MSLYGLERRVNHSPFQFDKVYRSRCVMDEQAAEDGVYIGRYVLIQYSEDKYNLPEGTSIDPDITSEEKDYIVTSQTQSLEYNDETATASISTANEALSRLYINIQNNTEFQTNLNKDLEKYGNSYHNTVWMKIQANGVLQYIMIAELNAVVPQLEIEANIPAVKQANEDGTAVIKWQEPYFDLDKSSELKYTLKMPQTLELEATVGPTDENAFSIYYDNTNGGKTNVDDNTVGVEYWLNGVLAKGTQANQEKININLQGLSDLIGIFSDALFGKSDENSDLRPAFEIKDGKPVLKDFSNIGNLDNGFLQLLSGLLDENGNLQLDWTKEKPIQGEPNGIGYISNKPRVIGLADDSPDIELNLTATTVIQ